jgi:hypothetical protein
VLGDLLVTIGVRAGRPDKGDRVKNRAMVSGLAPLCDAAKSWDGPTGNGTPNGIKGFWLDT